jgi:23S rRNA pseudouridine2605 synthase
MSESSIRIAKFMAECGIASRRKSEELIASGKVRINGHIVKDMPTKVNDMDKIEVFGKTIHRQKELKVWIFHKPRGALTTSFDPQGRKTIYDVLPKRLKNVITVGRLDFNTEGLLILTNNGDFSRKLELPSSKISREYRVRLLGKLTKEMIDKIEAGIVVNGIKYQKCQVTLEKESHDIKGKNFWLRIVLTEGKNREIRNIFEHFKLKVSKLIRISYGPFHLEGIRPGEVIEVPKDVVKCLEDLI